MITAYALRDGRVHDVRLEPGQDVPESTVWIDLLQPEEEERNYISKALSLDLPTLSEMEEIEASSRLYLEGDALFMTTSILSAAESIHPTVDDLTIVITPTHMLTVRFCKPRALDTFAFRIRRQPDMLATSVDAALCMLDAVADRTADILEYVAHQIDDLSTEIFQQNADHALEQKRHQLTPRYHGKWLDTAMRGLSQSGDMIHKIRECLNGMLRLQVFMDTNFLGRLSKEQSSRLRTLDTDLRSLSDHAQFLAHETTFLLDAVLGLISIEQNNIIKIFSVAAVAFLPPTLIASIYGMNFHHMPELDQPWAYPLALVLIALSAVVPVWLFKLRGWL